MHSSCELPELVPKLSLCRYYHQGSEFSAAWLAGPGGKL